MNGMRSDVTVWILKGDWRAVHLSLLMSQNFVREFH